MKSEPDVYSIDDLKCDSRTFWSGVRNFQARNFLRDEMTAGDLVLFYHSGTKDKGVVGTARVSRGGYPDPTQFDRRSEYFDAKATKENPIWFVVDVEFVEKFPAVVSLEEIKATKELAGMMVAKRGARLSVQPVEKRHFEVVRRLGRGGCADVSGG
jgi:predicted RNA-binding protein with PUA-like domain